MTELSSRYDPKTVEAKWLSIWKDGNVFHAVPSDKKPFTIVIPPPNVTGILHMGHALNNTLQDILVRYKRMRGFEALWMPGTDHAGIATQNVVEKQLAKEGKTRYDIGREAMLGRLWAWKNEYGGTILKQLEKLGSSCDWPRTRFTMDDAYSEAVKEVFIRLYEKDLIYRGNRIINWCPRCQTALSDEEAEHKDKNGKLYHIKYPFKNDSSKQLIVATTRPETMLGDTAVAINPTDERYKGYAGQTLVLPLIKREIKIIADEFVSLEFGTGAVKVTPAHDPNDFAMGERHGLETINIMRPDGVLNEQAGVFKDLDRFAARKAVIAALDEQGFLVKIEDHTHAVGHCYRCDTVVEPYLSKQWFVRMMPLAKPAADAVRNGQIKFHPERWEKVYLNWMDNIRDWCISRQIWWGHRIPVWYDDQSNAYVARTEAEAQQKAKGQRGKDVSLRQDEDVLDTWFSSWLWPFATLGWPAKNQDLEFFYPTNALFTASEIIFFWVARMIMAGYEFMGKAPFQDVYIHGTVRDAKGRKMSKSLGNALDPLEIIDEYGADALRFSLIINSGQDIFISKEKFEIGRNFANKIWNASRLIFMNVSPEAFKDYQNFEFDQLNLPSRWILSQLYSTISRTAEAIEKYRYSEAESLVQEFFWGSFCDWYLEIIKNQWKDVLVQKVALHVLSNSLKILHPFMPFITEEIYKNLQEGSVNLSNSSWPEYKKEYVSEDDQKTMQSMIDLISSIRNTRAQWNIKPNETVECVLSVADVRLLNAIQKDFENFQVLGKIRSVQFEAGLSKVNDAASGVVGEIRYFIPLSGIVDIQKEKRRMSDQFTQLEKTANAIAGRLQNSEFVKKAPPEVIAKDQERLQIIQKEMSELTSVISSLS
ncbi:MAG: valine--tRNA ligase [Candidatus Omnitrophica bacterium]|nr:valine--tRNA ligase [Candidatus Omnitrophota bacterium]